MAEKDINKKDDQKVNTDGNTQNKADIDSTDKSDKNSGSKSKSNIAGVLKSHPKLVKFMLFSIVLLLLLIMVAIRTDEGHNSKGKTDAGVSSERENTAFGNEADDASSPNEESSQEDDQNPDETDSSQTGNSKTDSPKTGASGDTGAEDNAKSENSGNESKNAEPEITLDAFDMLGTELSDIQNELGKGIIHSGENNCYFISAGATVEYDEDSKQINLVEIDGSGDNRALITLLGIKISDDLEDAKATLDRQGIDIIDLQENSFMCDFYLGSKQETVYEIYVTADEGKVDYISVCIK